jgi:DNA-binding Lrp family transcriptional regulator
MSSSLDEGKLRDVLEAEFDLTAMAIHRDSILATAVRPAQNSAKARPAVAQARSNRAKQPKVKRSPLDEKVLECLKDKKAWRTSELNAAVGKGRPVWPAITRLLKRGKIRKLRHGYYYIADLDTPPQINREVKKAPERSPLSDVLNLLSASTPKSAVELGNQLHITRIAVLVKLNRLIKKGAVRRVKMPGSGRRFAYVTVDPRQPPLKVPDAQTEKAKARRKKNSKPKAQRKGRKQAVNRFPAIIELLRQRGPLHAKDINSLLDNPYPGEAGIYMALGRLQKKGQIQRMPGTDPRRPLWALPQQEQAA